VVVFSRPFGTAREGISYPGLVSWATFVPSLRDSAEVGSRTSSVRSACACRHRPCTAPSIPLYVCSAPMGTRREKASEIAGPSTDVPGETGIRHSERSFATRSNNRTQPATGAKRWCLDGQSPDAKMPGFGPGAFACLFTAGWLLLGCLFRCLLCCLLGRSLLCCLLGRSLLRCLLCCFLNCQRNTSFS